MLCAEQLDSGLSKGYPIFLLLKHLLCATPGFESKIFIIHVSAVPLMNNLYLTA
jgi:hypothetical protein